MKSDFQYKQATITNTVKVDQMNGKVAVREDWLKCSLIPTHQNVYSDSLIIFYSLFLVRAAIFIANDQAAQRLHDFIFIKWFVIYVTIHFFKNKWCSAPCVYLETFSKTEHSLEKIMKNSLC